MASLSHSQARAIIQQAWQSVHGRAPTENELNYTQAIANLENGYGRAGQFANFASQGAYNWGSLEKAKPSGGECPPGTVEGGDQGGAVPGVREPVCFLAYSSDVAAAKAYITTLTKRHWPTIQAMKGTPEDVAKAMRVPPVYYVGPAGSEDFKITTYANAIRSNLKAIGASIPGGSGSALSWIIWGGLAAGGLYWYSQRYGTPKWLESLGFYK